MKSDNSIRYHISRGDKMADWEKVKNEYINSKISYRKLAEKHGVSFATLQAKAKKENWKVLHDKQYDKIQSDIRQKVASVIVKKEVDRLTRITNVADKLITKLEEATDQLNNHLVVNKRKTKTVVYDNEIKKPTKETIDELEEKQFIIGDVDKQGLKQLTAALKDLKDVLSTDSNINDDETGIAIIAPVKKE